MLLQAMIIRHGPLAASQIMEACRFCEQFSWLASKNSSISITYSLSDSSTTSSESQQSNSSSSSSSASDSSSVTYNVVDVLTAENLHLPLNSYGSFDTSSFTTSELAVSYSKVKGLIDIKKMMVTVSIYLWRSSEIVFCWTKLRELHSLGRYILKALQHPLCPRKNLFLTPRKLTPQIFPKVIY